MKKTEEEYHKIIKQLRNTEPKLHDTVKITEKIMSELRCRQKNAYRIKRDAIIIILRPVMAAAATLLFILFINLHFNKITSDTYVKENNNRINIQDAKTFKKNINAQTYEKITNKISYCTEALNEPLSGFNRQCLISLALYYNENNQLNNKRDRLKRLSLNKQTIKIQKP